MKIYTIYIPLDNTMETFSVKGDYSKTQDNGVTLIFKTLQGYADELVAKVPTSGLVIIKDA